MATQNTHYRPKINTQDIDLNNISADLFDKVAREKAENIAKDNKSNKPTQLRKFYDEIVMWESKTSQHPEKFAEFLPFIRMLNAKAAYAKGRKLVNEDYVTLLSACLKQVNNDKTMRHFKLFMEAFMGFYKEQEAKNERR
jgi:CRISPR-associated protein Csm2